MVANNLANADTLGYKKDAPTFKEYLSNVERDIGLQDIPRGPIKDKDLYPLDGRDQSFVIVDGTYTDFRQGHLRVTQSPFDVALDGKGFLEVATPQGIRFTRQGSLHVAQDGRLVTTDGHPVLAAQAGGLAAPTPTSEGRGPASGKFDPASAASRYINLKDRGAQFSITAEGEIYAGEDLVAKLSVAEFQNPQLLRKVGGSMFEDLTPPGAKNGRLPTSSTIVRQGVLEVSNVNPVEEMTKLIQANRLFEMDLKAMKTYGDILQKETTEVGKL